MTAVSNCAGFLHSVLDRIRGEVRESEASLRFCFLSNLKGVAMSLAKKIECAIAILVVYAPFVVAIVLYFNPQYR